MPRLATETFLARCAIIGLMLVHPGHATAGIVIDGVRDAAYGTPIATQTTQTGGWDAGLPDGHHQVLGSELDAVHASFDGDTLSLLFTGNLYARLRPNGPGSYFDMLWVFFDTGLGGQDSVSAGATSRLNLLAGLKFDEGFHPSHAIEVNVRALDGLTEYWQSTLPSDGASTEVFLGQTAINTGTVLLEMPQNTFHIQAAVNDTNLVGVDRGCGAASGGGADHGIELRVPLAALGATTTCLRLSAFLQIGSHHFNETEGIQDLTVLNQSLPPMPPGTCNPGLPSQVDFRAIAGEQFFTLCLPGADVPPARPVKLALSAPRPSPSTGGIRFTVSVPVREPVECVVVDALGRRVAQLGNRVLAAGENELAWSGANDSGARVAPGVYFVQARAAGETVARRAVLVGAR